jgi:hypothetical protein
MMANSVHYAENGAIPPPKSCSGPLNQPALTGGLFFAQRNGPSPGELGPKSGSAGREGSDTIFDVVSQPRPDH